MMTFEQKIYFMLSAIIIVPMLVATLLVKIKKHDNFIEAFLFSLFAAILVVSVLEALGNSIVIQFIKQKDLSNEEALIYILKIYAVYVLASFGGSSFIIKAHEYLFGEKLTLDRIVKKVDQIGEQANKAAELAMQGESKEKQEIKRLLHIINDANGGITISAIPNDLQAIINEAVKMSAIKAVNNKDKKVVFVLTDLGTKLLSSS